MQVFPFLIFCEWTADYLLTEDNPKIVLLTLLTLGSPSKMDRSEYLHFTSETHCSLKTLPGLQMFVVKLT